MRRWVLGAGLAVLLAMDGTTVVAQSQQSVSVRAFRFFRADTRKTLVTAFVEVPYALFTPTDSSANGDLKYGVVVSIQDANGIRLTDASWPGKGKAFFGDSGAVAVEMLDFPLLPGNFKVTVEVTDSVSGKHFVGSTEVTAWSAAPHVSDLLLSPAMRLATGGDTMPNRGERRWGNTLVTATNRLRLTPVRSRAYYLLEAYSETGDSGTMTVSVSDSTGKSMVSSRPASVKVAPGGSVLKGVLDLAGLPEGVYSLTVKLALRSRTDELSDKLVMADFNETMKKEEGRLAALRETDQGYFGLMNDTELDEAEAPLVYLVNQSELSVWKTNPSTAAKQKFLTDFWARRDPTPGTARNEAREVFYREIDNVNQLYREGGRSARAGWKTDRGRIRIKNGTPTEILDRRTSLGKAPPYEVWRFSTGKERYYVFGDRTGFGNYELLATNDLRENGRTGWTELVGPQALQDIGRFLNIDFFRSENPSASGSPGTQ